MKVVDKNYTEIENYDLTKGYLETTYMLKEDIQSVNGQLPFNSENYEEVKIYRENGSQVPTQLDKIESQIAFLAMMTDNIKFLEGAKDV